MLDFRAQTIQEELPYAVIIDFSSTATSLGHEEAEAEILSQTQLQEQEQKQRVEIISQAIDTQIPLIVDLAKGPLKEDEVRMVSVQRSCFLLFSSFFFFWLLLSSAVARPRQVLGFLAS